MIIERVLNLAEENFWNKKLVFKYDLLVDCYFY